MRAFAAPLKKPHAFSDARSRLPLRQKKQIARQREADARDRDRSLYGPYSSDVRFLRQRGFAITRDGLLFSLGHCSVDGERLREVADRERRLAGVAG